MGYASDVIFHIPFDSLPILEAKSSHLLTQYGDTPLMVNAKFETGWQMSDTTYVGLSDSILASSGITIGFWLKSVNPGVVTDPSDLETVPLLMPVLSKATFSGTTTIAASPWTFIIWEETQTDGTNVIKIAIRGLLNLSMVSCTLTSSSYEVGKFHHFWFTFEGGSTPSLRVFVDAVEDFGASLSGTLPSQLALNASTLTINNSVIGDAFQIARNQGTIDDLVIFSTVKTDSETIQQAANDGAVFVALTEDVGSIELNQAIIFDDPGTAQITGVYPNRGRVYVSKSDGKLLRGEKLLWESRKDFSKDTELEKVSVIKKTPSGSVEISENAFQIVDAVVRL